MRSLLILALTAAAVGFSAHAATETAQGSALILERVSISVVSDKVLPSIQTQSLGNLSSSSSSISRSAGPLGSNAALTIRTESGDTLSMAVPASFEVVRSGSTEGLTVKTTTDTQLQVGQSGVLVGGADMADGTMSVNVGGLINLAAGGEIPAALYEGTLVVLVQYN